MICAFGLPLTPLRRVVAPTGGGAHGWRRPRVAAWRSSSTCHERYNTTKQKDPKKTTRNAHQESLSGP